MKINYDKGTGLIFEFETSNMAGEVLMESLWLAPDGTLKFNHLNFGASVIRHPHAVKSCHAHSTNDATVMSLSAWFRDGSSTHLVECMGIVMGVYNYEGNQEPVINGRRFDYSGCMFVDESKRAASLAEFNAGLGKAADIATKLWEQMYLSDDDINLAEGFETLTDCPCGTDHIAEIVGTINGTSKPTEPFNIELSDDDIAYLRDALGIKIN